MNEAAALLLNLTPSTSISEAPEAVKRRAHRSTGNNRGRGRQPREALWRDGATKVFFARITEGETSGAARVAASKWHRKKVLQSGLSARTCQRLWDLFGPALQPRMFFQEGPTPPVTRHLASLATLVAAAGCDAVDQILRPHGYGKAQLSAGEQTRGNRTNGATSPLLMLAQIALALKYCLNLPPPTDGSPSGMVGVDIGGAIGTVALLGAASGAFGEMAAIECVKARHDAAEILVAESAEVLQCGVHLFHGNALSPCVEFGFNDILGRANFAALNNVCYSQELNRKICEGPLRRLPAGAVVVTLERLDAPCDFRRARRTPAWTSERRPAAVQADEDMVVVFLGGTDASADPLAPRLEQICVQEVKHGLGWTDTSAFVTVYRRAGGP